MFCLSRGTQDGGSTNQFSRHNRRSHPDDRRADCIAGPIGPGIDLMGDCLLACGDRLKNDIIVSFLV